MLGIKKDDLLLASEIIIADNSNSHQLLFLKKSYIISSLDKELIKFLSSFKISSQNIEEYLKKHSEQTVPAEKLFFWYDTKGIPIELITHSLSKRGKSFDLQTFNKLLNQQRERSFSHRPKVNIFDF